MSANSSAVEEVNKNPLANTSSTQESNERIVNKRGRPKSENSIRFGPQPKSLVAQMLIQLKKKKTESSEVTVISDDEESKTIEASIDSQDEACVPNSDFICKLCSHSSTSQEEYDKHHSTHKTFVCYYPNCTYTCKLSCNLIKHKRIHTDEKPYVCDECAFRTNFINSLKAHKRIHTSERPHKCQWCDYQCNSSSNLKKHCRHRHNGAP